MNLTVDQRKKLNAVMVALFLDRDDLKIWLRTNLGFKLDDHVGQDAALSAAVAETIAIFEPENKPETDLAQLLPALVAEFPSNPQLNALLISIIETDDTQDEQSEPEKIHEALNPAQQRGEGLGQAARRLTGEKAQKPSQGLSRAAPKPVEISPHQAGKMTSAVHTLKKLKSELDKALADFVATYSADFEPDFEKGATAEVALECIERHATAIEISEDRDASVTELRLLLSDVIAGIEIAERAMEYDTIQKLSAQAAGSCLSVAERTEDAEQLLLNGVVPYWRMREAYAQHQDKSLIKAR